MTEIPVKLLPVFWIAISLSGVAGFSLIVGLTLLLGSQRPHVLRLVWISAAVLLAAVTAWVLILAHH